MLEAAREVDLDLVARPPLSPKKLSLLINSRPIERSGFRFRHSVQYSTILGTFHTARGIVEISEEEVLVPGRDHLSRFCFGNGVVSIQIN